MKLSIKSFLKLCLVVAILPITQVNAADTYYNNALAPTYRTTQTTMQDAVTGGKTSGSIVTSVKNQGDYGTCWAFAVDAAVETSLMKQMEKAGLAPKNFDISEKYNAWMIYAPTAAEKDNPKTAAHAYFVPKMETNQEELKKYPTVEPNRSYFSALNQGGNIYHEISTLTGKFLVEETGNPKLQYYTATNDVLQNEVSSIVSPSYIARDIYTKYSTNSTMGINSSSQLANLNTYKDLLKSTGSLRVNYYVGPTPTGTVTGNNANGNIYNADGSVGINHAVLIVGYDDNYDFSSDTVLTNKPTEKGAWIVKNSWGTAPNSGDAGYFYISYYDKTLNFSSASVIEPDLARYTITDTHTPIYSAGTFPSTTKTATNSSATFASKYMAGENQFVKAVSFLTNTDGASYTIDILKSANDPREKSIYTKSGTFSGDNKMSGYHTVDLDKFILLPKDENYVIKVTVTSANGAVGTEVINVSIADSTSKLVFKDGESYILNSQNEWGDIGPQAAAFLNGQAKETNKANGGNFTVGSLSCGKNSNVSINLGKANENYGTDILNTARKTISNMTADIGVNEDFWGTIYGEGSVIKKGVGELSFLKDNTYTGTTSVNQGTLNNYSSITSNVDVSSGATYKVINTANKKINERGISNAGNVFIVADKKGIIQFANQSNTDVKDCLQDLGTGKWYLNAFDAALKNKSTGTILVDVDTSAVKGNVYLAGGTVKMSSGQTNLFTNAKKYNSNGIKIDVKKQVVKSSAPTLMLMSSPTTVHLNEVDLGKMVIEGTSELDVDATLSKTDLMTDLVKGTIVKDDDSVDNTANKIKLGFTLTKDETFTDVTNGVSSSVTQGQIGKVVNNSAFVITRDGATGSYNVYYNYDATGQTGLLKIVNAADPISLQDAISSTVTSKYYSLEDNQVLTSAWHPNLLGNDLTLVGSNTTVDGDKKTQVFNVSTDKMLNLNDVSITQGVGTAIHNEGALSVSATNSEVKLSSNDGVNGGAIYNKNNATLLTSGNNLKIQNNTATNGAGIYNDTDSAINTPTVTATAAIGDIALENNNATSNGGAIYNKGEVDLSAMAGNVQINNNNAQSGAGIYNTGSASIETIDGQAVFSSNKATTNGGAIANDGGSVELLAQGGNINFSQNQAVNGGAIYNTKTGVNDAVVDIIADTGNVIFDGNKATDKGGAIYNTETANVLASDNQSVAFKQTKDSIYNTGTVNLNYNNKYGATGGLISTGAELGGAGLYNLYGGELAFVKATDNQNVVGSISHDATLSIINSAILNLANGVKEVFNPGTLSIASNSALYVAIDCILHGNTSEGDFLNAGTYSGNKSQIVIEAVNLIKSNDANKTYYRVNIAEGSTLKTAIAQDVMADILGYRSAYSSQTGDLILLSTSIKGLVDYIESTDANRTYSLAQDELVVFPLGTMGGTNSTLSINGNNNKIISEFSDVDGITVSSTNTLNANSVTFKDFGTAITNKGKLNLDNVRFNGQAGSSSYDVNNTGKMTATNYVSGKVLNSGIFNAVNTNDLSGLTLRSVDGSTIDLHNTTNNVSLNSLSIAGNVDLYINGGYKLSAVSVSKDATTDSLLIKYASGITSINTTVTETSDLKSLISMADNAVFELSNSAKPTGTYDAYKLTYSNGVISVNGANLSDTSTKSGSYNLENSATNFVASLTNTIASGTTVTLNSSQPQLGVKLPNATTVSGTFGLNNIALSGGTLTLASSANASLNVADSTVKNQLVLNGGTTAVSGSSLNGDINMASTAQLSFSGGTNTVNGAITGVAGSRLIVDAPTTFNNTVDPLAEAVNAPVTHNANVYGIDFTLNDGGTLTFTKDSYLNSDNTNTMYFNGGSLNLMNGVASTINLQSLSFAAATSSAVFSNIYVDVDLANKTMDKLTSNTISVGSGSVLNVAGMRLLSDAKSDNMSINFTQDSNLKSIVTTNVSSVAYSPIYKYLVDYSSSSGNFNFSRSYNPAILASSIAAQIGSYLTQVNTYEQAFGNMDMMMSMSAGQRQAMKFANKIASVGSDANLATFSPNQIPEQDKGLWFRPYTTFENVPLNNGPTVGNIAYGSLFGGDTPIIELKNGWDAVYTAYAGYNGSNQNYEGVGIDQNGATLGATGLFYKGNLFTGLTANVGANAASAYTMYGKEDFTTLAAGIASKTGYNWELNGGKFIIQPSYLMSYSFINTFNYTNAGGANITSDPLNSIQISPGVKFIGNLKNGWQPYALVQMVWNIMDQSKFTANDVSLPELSVKPYIQYGIGLQRRWGERFTGYGQALIRNGGRNGIALQFGFRYAMGKAPISGAKESLKKKSAMFKKCDINLQSFKSEDQITR